MPPRFSFAVSDIHYTVTFVVMLGVALLVGQITARLRFQATVAADREHRMRALFEMARDLSSALTLEQTADLSQHFVTRVFDVPALLLVLNDKEQIESTPGSEVPPEVDLSIAQWAADHTTSAGLTTDTLASSPALYLPLKAAMRTRGVLALVPNKVVCWKPARRSSRSRSSASTSYPSPRMRCCTWNRSACATRCCRRSRTI